jgi:uncharacterized ferritin-like protein (DUF455 family)
MDNRAMLQTPAPPELRQMALSALLETDLDEKVAIAQSVRTQAATLLIAIDKQLQAPPHLPGCPARPELRAHLDVPKRSPFTPDGLAALLHAVAHIEFNAIKTV